MDKWELWFWDLVARTGAPPALLMAAIVGTVAVVGVILARRATR